MEPPVTILKLKNKFKELQNFEPWLCLETKNQTSKCVEDLSEHLAVIANFASDLESFVQAKDTPPHQKNTANNIRCELALLQASRESQFNLAKCLNEMADLIDKEKEAQKQIAESINAAQDTLDKKINTAETTLDTKIEAAKNAMNEQIKEAQGKIVTAKEGLTAEINSAKEDIQKSEINLKSEINKASLQATKDSIATMGTFASIIAVIMYLVVSTSSWLNNADGASAIIAFIVPSGVVILAICALTAFIKILSNQKQDSSSGTWQEWLPWIIISSITAVVIVGTIGLYYWNSWNEQKIREANSQHLLIKLPESKVIIDETTNDAYISYFDPETEKPKYVPLRIAGELRPELNHDGFVHYCLIHEELE